VTLTGARRTAFLRDFPRLFALGCLLWLCAKLLRGKNDEDAGLAAAITRWCNAVEERWR
jgi:hypothetical protein